MTFFILLPLSIPRRLRRFGGYCIYITSYILGMTLWVWGLLLTDFLWGRLAVVLGLVFAGAGVVPVAILASLSKGMWSEVGYFALGIILAFGSHFIGQSFLKETAKPKSEDLKAGR